MARTKELTLDRTSTLLDCERLLKDIQLSTSPTMVSLPSDNRGIFLRDLRMLPILSTASRKPNVHLSWHPESSAETYGLLIALAGAVYGCPIPERSPFPSIQVAQHTLARRYDILEDPPGSKETLTFCAIDQESRTQPIALAGHSHKAGFIELLATSIQQYFDRGSSQLFSSRIGPSLFDSGPSTADYVYGFLYEIYQNTFHHGSLDRDQQTIPGLRLIRLRKRISTAEGRGGFISGATGFPELEEYFHEVAPSHSEFKFYEISISDNGMGILSRYRSIANPKKTVLPQNNTDLALLNRIVSESLSSDVRKSHVGRGGLRRALRAVDKVRGFLSLRSDSLWVYRSHTQGDQSSQGTWLQPVSHSKNLPTISGTHFSLIVPASP